MKKLEGLCMKVNSFVQLKCYRILIGGILYMVFHHRMES